MNYIEHNMRNLVQSADAEFRSLVRYWAFPVLRPRRFHGFGVGMAKTGTHSLATVFQSYRSEHEPDIQKYMRTAMERSTLTESQTRDRVHRLDRSNWLELNSSWVNIFILDVLLEEFPEAKFVLTIRDCYSWLDSVFNQLLSRGRQVGGEHFDRLYLESMAPATHQAGDQVLSERGLWPLDLWLRIWRDQNTRVVEMVPRERLLVVRTHEIGHDIPKLADFFGVPAVTLNAERSHSFKAAQKFWILSDIDKVYLADRVEANCKDLMDEFFPEVRGLDDVRGYGPADIRRRQMDR